MDLITQMALWTKWNDDEYKKKDEQNKKNHTSETGGPVHTGGSIPFTES